MFSSYTGDFLPNGVHLLRTAKHGYIVILVGDMDARFSWLADLESRLGLDFCSPENRNDCFFLVRNSDSQIAGTPSSVRPLQVCDGARSTTSKFAANRGTVYNIVCRTGAILSTTRWSALSSPCFSGRSRCVALQHQPFV